MIQSVLTRWNNKLLAVVIAEKAKLDCRDSVNRWTDNIFILKSWMKKKFTGMDKQIDGFFVQV